MAWYWSDDVARAAIEAGLVQRSSVQEWLDRPVAMAGEEGLDHYEVAARHLGLSDEAAAGAA